MPEYILTFLDTAGIQDYIFGSNVLRENVGASELVWQATHLWPLQVLYAQNWRTNIQSGRAPTGEAEDLDLAQHIEKDKLDAEVLYRGGGNCALLFASPDLARAFTIELGKRALAAAPGLNLVVAHVPVNWDAEALSGKVREALSALVLQKQQRHVSTPLLGLATTAACSSTGLPAVGADGRLCSADVLARLAVWPQGERRLRAVLKRQLKLADLEIPYDFDHLGRQAGDISYLAVVHADGNGMGQRVQRLEADFPAPDQNRAYITALRAFSAAIETAAGQALDALAGRLLEHWSITEDTREEAIIGKTQRQPQDAWTALNAVVMARDKKPPHKPYLPFRPLVFGGDDLTFVTDGRLGLSLAAAYLQTFAQAITAQGNPYLNDLQASAGVAIVKTHYPFARAYELAVDLCRNAKEQYRREYAALDWHIAATGLFGNIQEIRQRQYTVRDGHLEMRPLLCQARPGHWRTWDGFSDVARELWLEPDWADAHNKVLDLREALRAGPHGVVHFRRTYELAELPLLASGIQALQTTGWDGAGRCGYFDAVEALDFFLPLERGKEPR
jgi:hypothetical protein